MVVSISHVEGMAVQLSEAKRLATFADVHHQRLALLLLDNASEVSLRRSADAVLTRTAMYGQLKQQLGSSPIPLEGEMEALLAKAEALAVSRTTIRKIERSYDSLVDFVASKASESLSPEHAACLKVLHRFRNAAYHRDLVRPDVLAPAVDIMFFLCCHLLKNEARGFVHELGATPDVVRSLLPVGSPGSADFPGTSDAVTLSKQLADVFLADLELDHASISVALSRHILGRLDQLDADLQEIALEGPPATLDITLRLVQQAPSTPEQFNEPTPDDFWTQPLPVTASTLREWRAQASAFAGLDDARVALQTFAAIDISLEELETPVARFIQDIEREAELRSDR